MNERIRQLATQATRQYSPTYYTQEWIQGFAEAIVQECITILDEDDGATHHTELLKEHFGVEE